eukprot:gene12528-16803_t
MQMQNSFTHKIKLLWESWSEQKLLQFSVVVEINIVEVLAAVGLYKMVKKSYAEDVSDDSGDVTNEMMDDDDYNKDENEDDYDNESQMSVDDIDEELALPDVLASIGLEEKKELLRFKRSHNEREWEVEVLRRTDMRAKKIDLERLKMMAQQSESTKNKSARGSKKIAVNKKKSVVESEYDEDDDNSVDFPPVKASAAKKKATRGRPAKKANRSAALEDGEEDDEDAVINTGDKASDKDSAMDVDDDDDDDHLFDSDEEEEINKRVKTKDIENEGDDVLNSDDENENYKPRKSKVLGKKRDSLSELTKNDKNSSTVRRSSRQIPAKGQDDDEDEEEDYHDSKLDFKVKGSKRLRDDEYEEEDVEEDEEEDGGKIDTKFVEVDNSPPAEIEQYHLIQTRRIAIEKWLSEPYLKAALMNTFVKFSIGEVSGETVYRMAQIVDVVNVKPYKPLGSDITYPIKLMVEIAGSQKKITVEIVSNSRIKENEFNYYLDMLKSKDLESSRLTVNQVDNIHKKQVDAVRHVYTNEDIKMMVASKLGLRKDVTTDYETAEKILREKLKNAIAEQDFDLMSELQKTLDFMNNKMESQKLKFERAAKRQMDVNKKNREGNITRDMMAGKKKRQDDKDALAKGIQSNSVADPFIRRETKPKILWNTGAKLLDAKDKDQNKEGAKGDSTASTIITTSNANNNNKNVKDSSLGRQIQREDSNGYPVMANDLSLEMIRQHVKNRLGIDPYEHFLIPPRERYLRKSCSMLPPVSHPDRAKLRNGGISLQEAILSSQGNQ